MRERFRRWRHAPTANASSLTPASFASDAVGADRYLTHEFDLHRSTEAQKTRATSADWGRPALWSSMGRGLAPLSWEV